MTMSREGFDPAEDVGAPDVLAHVRRALRASAAELAKSLDEVPSSDRRRQRALDRWFAGFAAQLRLHHELVDTMVIPALAARGALDQRSLDTIAADHAWIDQILSDLGDALGVLAFGLGAPDWWIGKASDLAAAMSHVLSGQLAREQRLLTPLVDRWFAPREREVVRHEAMRHVATRSSPLLPRLAVLPRRRFDPDAARRLRPDGEPDDVALPARRLRAHHARWATSALGG